MPPFSPSSISQAFHRASCPYRPLLFSRNAHRRAIKMNQKPMTKKNVPTDIGLLEGTFIMPSNPSFFKSPRTRLRLYWYRIVKMIENFRLALAYKYTTETKPRPKIEFFQLHRTARDLHQRMFTALAEGQKSKLSTLCCSGLKKTLFSHIDQRAARNDRTRWKLHQYKGYARVVCTRTAVMREIKGFALRQHVVKLRSVQSVRRPRAQPITKTLEQTDRDGKVGKEAAGGKEGEKDKEEGKEEEEWDEETRTVTDYVVLQKMMVEGKEGPWMIWGTVQETDAKEVLAPLGKKVPHVAV